MQRPLVSSLWQVPATSMSKISIQHKKLIETSNSSFSLHSTQFNGLSHNKTPRTLEEELDIYSQKPKSGFLEIVK